MLQRFQFSPDDYSAGQNTTVVTYKINKIIAKAGLKKQKRNGVKDHCCTRHGVDCHTVAANTS